MVLASAGAVPTVAKATSEARLEELSVRLSFKYFQNMHEISFEWSSFKRHCLYMIDSGVVPFEIAGTGLFPGLVAGLKSAVA